MSLVKSCEWLPQLVQVYKSTPLLLGLEDDSKLTDRDDGKHEASNTDSDVSEEEEEREMFDEDLAPIESNYVENAVEELGKQGDACQTEEVADENKSILWSLIKQVQTFCTKSKDLGFILTLTKIIVCRATCLVLVKMDIK